MNNYNYYGQSLAYDFDMFMPSSAAPEIGEKEGRIIEHPAVVRKAEKTRASLRSKIAAAAIITFMVAMIFANIFTRAEIMRVDAEVESINTEITKLESEKTRLTCEIEQKTSYKNVEKSAEELGMTKISKNQVVYIKTNDGDKAENSKGEIK